jgi:hypothetical protein
MVGQSQQHVSSNVSHVTIAGHISMLLVQHGYLEQLKEQQVAQFHY